MSNMYVDFEINMKKRPHIVILGAGASCATIPHGDKFGKKISAMNGFIDKLGLNDILTKVKINTPSNNLEDIYMELDERSFTEPRCQEVKEKLENEIRDYMLSYHIPDEPTIYDFLLLSLTSKDLIATFNWDPLLVQALNRVVKITTNIPALAFLHGNVGVGFCKDDNVMGNISSICSKCGKALSPMKLLFPIKKKDYNSDVAISKSWATLCNALEVAYMVTIFGYSAPKSDFEAVKMLKLAWGRVEDRNLEEIELVDIRDEDSVISSWDDFIHTHHYSFHNTFFDTTLARYPRRSCEATFDRLMKLHWLDGSNGFKDDMSFDDIKQFVKSLLDDENNAKTHNTMLADPYIAKKH